MKKRKALPAFPHQFFYFIGLRIRRMLLKFAGRLVPPPMAVYEKAQGFWISRAIVAACELNLADHLASGMKNITELAVLSGSDEANLYRLMRALAGERVFRELPGKMFVNTPLSCALKEGDNSMKYMILHQFGETNMTLFTGFTECIRTGEGNTSKLLGKKIFQYLEENPAENEIYNMAMDNSSGLVSMALISAYDFKGIKTLVDVGGGHGIVLANILEKYGDMKGILFDQQHVIDPARKMAGASILKERFHIVGGNFFNDIPSGADAYFMKNILHAFSDEDCLELLGKIHSVMAPNGKLIILETVIEPDNKPSFGKLVDLLMMTGTEGGKERTIGEFSGLLNRSGFQVSKLIPTIAPLSVLEAVKK
jgi:ubiquinone/menaquinone biosynthesis C-methylase UbiE